MGLPGGEELEFIGEISSLLSRTYIIYYLLLAPNRVYNRAILNWQGFMIKRKIQLILKN
jgi:hypothetical protein